MRVTGFLHGPVSILQAGCYLRSGARRQCLEEPKEAGGTIRKHQNGIHSWKGRQRKQMKPSSFTGGRPLDLCNREEGMGVGSETGGKAQVRHCSPTWQPAQGSPESGKVFECKALQPHTEPLLPPDNPAEEPCYAFVQLGRMVLFPSEGVARGTQGLTCWSLLPMLSWVLCKERCPPADQTPSVVQLSDGIARL